MLRMYEDVGRVRAQEKLDAAEAAAYPHMGKAMGEWAGRLSQMASRRIYTPMGARSPFTVNGMVVRPGNLAQAYRRALGSGSRE